MKSVKPSSTRMTALRPMMRLSCWLKQKDSPNSLDDFVLAEVQRKGFRPPLVSLANWKMCDGV
jgi:hypothetical protein